MTKDAQTDNSSNKDQPVEQRVLDRRTRKTGDQDERLPAQRPLSEDAFHETIGRYCRRFQKDGRDFCLASITVLEYKHASEKERDQLDKAVVGVLFKQLRAEDRICFVEPAHYLVLLPSAEIEEANVAIRRVTEKISQSKIKQKSSVMQPSAFSRVVSAQQKATQGQGEIVVDPETLYNSVGYTLNAKGKLLSLEDNEDSPSEPLFRGNFDGWMERYVPEKRSAAKKGVAASKASSNSTHLEGGASLVRMQDQWTGKALVEVRELKLSIDGTEVTTSSAASANLLRRLRILQNLDHPGINKLLDFYAFRDGSLLLVNRPPEGIELTREYLNGKSESPAETDADATVLISWLQQILGALIAMQSLVPPVVPASFDGIRVFYFDTDNKDGGQIVLSNFDTDYLSSSAQLNSESGGHVAASGQQNLLDGIVKFILEFAARSEKTPELVKLVKVLENLDANSLSTPYKLRAHLKKFAEEQNA
ncbi:MAG: hypothetical protein SGJ27_20090 [Candidatus Melainabacteria bacterium]|nr:hypothetical protein [Candidatus Melainabacteria bacterium]